MLLNSPKIVLAGSVNSSKKTLEKLFEYNMNVVGVLGLDPSVAENVSGYVDLGKMANEQKVNFQYFKYINTDEVVQFVEDCGPDYIFVVGLSQLVKEPLLSLPSLECIGFHPTKLPKGRGRGAVAWLILGKAPGAATFFQMGKGMDDGPILAQKEFEVSEEDYAQDVIDKIIEQIGDCLDELLPKMKSGSLKAVEQDHSQATYLGKRNPEDGWIDWSNSASEIARLVRAVSKPLPGAYSFINGQKINIYKASVEDNPNHVGVVGRILKSDYQEGILVQTGNGSIWLKEFKGISFSEFKVGQTFGSLQDYRIDNLSQKFERLRYSYSDE